MNLLRIQSLPWKQKNKKAGENRGNSLRFVRVGDVKMNISAISLLRVKRTSVCRVFHSFFYRQGGILNSINVYAVDKGMARNFGDICPILIFPCYCQVLHYV